MADIYYYILNYNIIHQSYFLKYGKEPKTFVLKIELAFDNDRSIEGIWH